MIKDKFREALDKIVPEDTEEHKAILIAYDLIMEANPVVASQAKNHLILLDRSRTELSALYYMISQRIVKLQKSFQETYDSAYVSLVRRGRPSKDAIEAEIRSMNPEYTGVYYQIEDLSTVKDLINMLLRSIDASKSSTIEILRNINRID